MIGPRSPTFSWTGLKMLVEMHLTVPVVLCLSPLIFRSHGGWTPLRATFRVLRQHCMTWAAPEFDLMCVGREIGFLAPLLPPTPAFRGKVLALGLHLADSLPLLSPTGTDMAVFCLLCGKRFQAQSALQQHMEVHAGVRSYICSECNRTFPSHTALKRHLRSHTGRLVPGWMGTFPDLISGLNLQNIRCVLGCGWGAFQVEAFSAFLCLKLYIEGLL